MEDMNTEWKEVWHPNFYKEVVAFANTNGGVVWVGVDDDGRHVGVKDVDGDLTRITNGIRDAIKPDLTMFVRCQPHSDNTIKIDVSEGVINPIIWRAKA